jgi:hypothetical protein
MSEKNAYSILRTGIAGKRTRIDRIENLCVLGMPDVNLCIEGNETWIEIKSPKEPKKSTTPLFGSNHKLELEQRNWIKRQIDSGGKAFVLIRSDKRCMLVCGSHADVINEKTVEELIAIALWHAPVPTKKEHWAKLRETLSC